MGVGEMGVGETGVGEMGIPLLCYGAEVWDFSKIIQQERIHLQFCKKLLGVKRTTQNDFVYGELGRVTLQVYIFQSIVKYWFKILECENAKYIKFAYELMLSDLHRKPNSVNWASKVKDLLSSMGFYDVWLAQGVGNKNVFLSEMKLRLKDNFVQNWQSRLADSSRARFYSLFSTFDHQLYLQQVNIKKFRVALSKLRVSSHRLEIEVGRWSRPNRIPIDERKCRVCDKLEDEFHFLLECQLFTDLRIKYLKRYYWTRPNMLKLKELMSSTNVKEIKYLSIYVEKAFKIRTELYTR